MSALNVLLTVITLMSLYVTVTGTGSIIKDWEENGK